MEHWEEHVQLLTLYAYDNDVAVYFDELLSQKRGDDDMPVNGWLFEYVGQMWRYADQQFGPLYQGNDPRFYTVFHVGRYNGCHIATQMEASHDFHHVLDCGSSSRTMWNTKTTSSTTNISWAVSHIGIRYARGVLGNPMWSIDQSALEHIVRYDICLGVNHPEVAQMVLDEFIDSPQTSPRAKSYWLRDFYLPVYNSYGNTTVLANYFSLLSTNFPTFVNNDGFRRYNNATITVTLGLYVHFWSGAANTSLQYMAAKAFGWTAQDSNDFRQAQKDFPRICYAGQYDDILLTQNRPLSVLLGISIPFVAVALTASAVACWWYRKKKRGQRIQAVSLRSLVSNSKECQYGRDTAFTDTDNAPNGGKDSDFVIGKDLKLFVVPRKRFKQSKLYN
ncbi:hypothetical protein RvY_12498-2 [Ramazzottius varieornatus]|nr:hypothetical protein RvY_12498-2 [Ramazzottius varieornatus]